jgi:hypothetical protein
MNTHKAILRIALPAALGAVAAGALWAQQQQGLVKIAPRAGAQDLALEVAASDWRERLTQDDLDLREQAFDALVGEAARDPALRARLEQWAGEDDGGLAWTSRLALRQLERRAAGPGWMTLDLHDGMHSFLPDVFQPLDLDQLQPFQLQPQRAPLGGGAQPQVESKAESFSLEQGPDGVKAKVTRDQDGESVTQEYEAESLEELLEAHPELGEHLAGAGALPFGGMGLRGALPRLQLDPRVFGLGQGLAPDPSGGAAAGPVRTDVLGVFVHPLTDEERARRGFQDVEGGLVVERSVPGTIAAGSGPTRRSAKPARQVNGRAERKGRRRRSADSQIGRAEELGQRRQNF